MEDAGTLTVETEVLGEALGDNQLKALLDEVPQGGGITGKVTRGEALVGTVEKREVVLLTKHRCQLFPLLQRRINTSGVVGARMKYDDAPFRGILDGRLHTLEVQPLGLLGEIGVLLDREADIGKDLVVVGPGGVGQVDGAVALVELGEEEGAKVDGAGA